MTAIAYRQRLPNRRLNRTFSFEHGGIGFIASIGHYGDGRVGEIFITAAKPGSTADLQAMDAAILCSLCLQFNIPIATIKHALLRDDRGRAASPIGAAIDLLAAEDVS